MRGASHQQKTRFTFLCDPATMKKNQVIHTFFARNNKLLNLSANNRTEEKKLSCVKLFKALATLAILTHSR